MNDEWKAWFEHLHDVKENLVKAHDDARDPIERWFADESDLYSDTAHFVYELIQNADDAGATEASFRLDNQKLVFSHNGTRRFRVSNIDDKEQDLLSGDYGEVNALTDRNGTTKKADNEAGNAIGKFGRGFKSVYGYTKTPSIYDKDIRFCLDRIIIPVDLSDQPDYPERRENETVIVLPFDRPEKPNPSSEILEKFRSLVMPTLFLNRLWKVSYEFGGVKGCYEKQKREKYNFNDLDSPPDCERVDMVHCEGETVTTTKLLIFSRVATCGLRCMVGFILDENGRVVASPLTNAFCYFPTRHETGLKFIVHAPFKLNATREGIKDEVQEPHNGDMVRFLASIAADGIECLRYITDKAGRPLLDDDIVDIVPTHPVCKVDYRDRLDLSPFYTSIKTRFLIKEILPASHGYVKRDNGCWPESQDLSKIITHEQLRNLLGRPDVDWVFPSRWADRQREGRYDYINELVWQRCTEDLVLQKITSGFVQAQTRDWLYAFLKWVAANWKRVKRAETLPIFLNQKNAACSAKNAAGEVVLFFPNDDGTCSESHKDDTVHLDLVRNEDACKLLRDYGVRKPNPEDEVRSIIRGDDWNSLDRETHLAAFGIVAEQYFNDSATDSLRRVIESELKQKKLLTKKQGVMEQYDHLYFPTERLSVYFSETTNRLVDFEGYLEVVRKIKTDDADKLLQDLLGKIGVATLPRKIKAVYHGLENKDPYRGKQWGMSRLNADEERAKWAESEYDGMVAFLDRIVNTNGKEEKLSRSLTLWFVLSELQKQENEGMFPQGIHYYLPDCKQNPRTESFDNYLCFRLQREKWVLNVEGNWVSPDETTVQRLDVQYKANEANNVFREMIGLKNDRRTELLEELKQIDPKLSDVILASQGGVVARKNANHKYRQQKMVSGESDEFLPMPQELKNRVEDNSASVDAGDEEQTDPLIDKGEDVVKVADFLKMNLSIPNYQRPYEWSRRNVEELLGDIEKMVYAKAQEKTKEFFCQLPYRIGTVVLQKDDKEHGDENGDKASAVYDVVDGQQRTLTLILLLLALGVKCSHLRNPDFYPALAQSPISRLNLHNNFIYINQYLDRHDRGFRGALKDILEDSLEVVVICVTKKDEAFQLFDSQNNRGRPLDPHDLLKAYHLREMNEQTKEHPELIKEEDVNKAVRAWEDIGTKELKHLFEDLLYPICKWTRRDSNRRFTSRDIHEFKGIPLVYEQKYGYAVRASRAGDRFQIGDQFVPGKDFFDLVNHYCELDHKIKEKVSGIDPVTSVLCQCDSSALRNLFDAALMCYFDRFGMELSDKDAEAAIKKLCLWVYTLRLDVEYIHPKTPNKYALGFDDGNGKYSNRIAMFYEIKNAIFHTELLSRLISHAQLAREEVSDSRKALWDALQAL